MTEEPTGGRATSGVDDARAARAVARASWPVRKTTLTDQSTAPAPAGSTAEERLAMMWPLALDAWALSGRPLPDYPRHAAPGGVVRAPGRGKR